MLPAAIKASALKNWTRVVCSEAGACMTPVALVTDVNLFYCAPGDLENLFDADFEDESRVGGDTGK